MSEPGGQLETEKQSGLPSPSQTPEASKPSESEITKARRLLNLPDRSPLLDQEKIASDRKAVIDSYCQKRLEEILDIKDNPNAGGFINGHLAQITKEEQEKQEAKEKTKGPSPITKWFMVNRMRRNGIKDPESTLSVIQSEDNRYFYPQSWSEKAVAANLAELNNEHLKIALHRLRILGYHVNSSDFETKAFITLLSGLATVSEENFQNACQELNPYFFIDNPVFACGVHTEDRGNLSPHFTVLMEIVRNGGLTPEQKQKLDQLQRCALLIEQNPIPTIGDEGNFRGRGGYWNETDDLSTLLGYQLPEGIATQALLVTEELVYHALQRQTKGEKINMEQETRDSYAYIDTLKKEGYLSGVCELINQGINCDNFIKYDRHHPPDKKWKELVTLFQKSLVLARNPEKLEWAALLAEVAGNGLDWDKADIYANMDEGIDRQEDLVNFGLFVRILPEKIKDQQFKDVSRWWNSTTGKFDLTEGIYHLFSELNQLKYIDLSEQEQLLVSKICSLLHNCGFDRYKNLKPEEKLALEKETPVILSFLGYLSQNQSRIGELIENGSLTSIAYEEMLGGKIKASNEDINFWISSHYDIFSYSSTKDILFKHIDVLDKYNLARLISAFSPIDFFDEAKYLSPETKIFIQKCQEYSALDSRFVLLLIENKDNFSLLFVEDGGFTPFLIEKAVKELNIPFSKLISIITEKTIQQFPPEEQSYWKFLRNTCPAYFRDFAFSLREKYASCFANGKPTSEFFEEGLKQQAFIADPDSLVEFLKADPAILTSLSKGENKIFWRFLANQDLTEIRSFVLQNRLNIPGLLTNEGLPTESFFIQASLSVPSETLVLLLTDQVLSTFTPEKQKFWQFYLKLPIDARHFLLQNQDQNPTYINSNGEIDERGFNHDFIQSVYTTPERIQTYATLAVTLETLGQQPLQSQERGLLFLKISEAYQINRLTQPVQVEDIVNLQRAFARLYRPDMDPFEIQCWRILQKQLPFTADEQVRIAMREQALVVEALDSPSQQRQVNRLSWVHQMIHNYASTKAPAYLKAFRQYLATGQDRELLQIRETYQAAACRCPDLVETDRQELQKALPQIDQLVELTDRFYNVDPQRLRNAINDILPVLSPYPGLEGELNELQQAAEIIANPSTPSEDALEATSNFCLSVNAARVRIIEAVTAVNVERKSRLLILDSVLSGLSQQFFVRFADQVQAQVQSGKFTARNTFKAGAVFHEMLTASLLEGENSDPDPDFNLVRKVTFFSRFKEPQTVLPWEVHSASLFVPVISARINTLWSRFIQVAQPEMKEMLVRLGVPEQEAFNRVYMTDLVEYKKKSMSYVIEPMIPLMMQMLKATEKELAGNAAKYYDTIIPPENTSYNQPEVDQAISLITRDTLPTELSEASVFLTKIAQSPHAKAEKLCRIYFPEYLNRNDPNQRPAVDISDKEGKLEIFPFSYFGIDCVLLRLNGQVIDNSEDYLAKRFHPTAAVKAFLREGG